MIPLTITRGDDRYHCATEQHQALATWLELELEDDGWSYDEGSLVEELFEGIGAVRAGRQETAVAWADLARVTVERETCVVDLFALGRCSLSADDLVAAVLQWFDVVNPLLAGRLRVIQAVADERLTTWAAKPVR